MARVAKEVKKVLGAITQAEDDEYQEVVIPIAFSRKRGGKCITFDMKVRAKHGDEIVICID